MACQNRQVVRHQHQKERDRILQELTFPSALAHHIVNTYQVHVMKGLIMLDGVVLSERVLVKESRYGRVRHRC